VLPALVSSPFDLELEMVQHLGTAVHRTFPRAAIVGVRLEGPYINSQVQNVGVNSSFGKDQVRQ